jgi:hypothetical protein
MNRTERVGIAVTLYTYILEVIVSNLGQDILIEGSRGFPPSLHSVVLRLDHYSCTIYILISSLNKQQKEGQKLKQYKCQRRRRLGLKNYHVWCQTPIYIYCDGLPDDRYRYDSPIVITNASMETPETVA